jgi:hypothetical protein
VPDSEKRSGSGRSRSCGRPRAQYGLFRDDGLDETGFASATGSDETDFATKHDFHRVLETVNVGSRAASAANNDLEGDLCEWVAVGVFLCP